MTPSTIIHLVHGTWGRGWRVHFEETLGLSSVTKLRWHRGSKSRAAQWFEEGSGFRAELASLLDEKGISGRYRFEEFTWSGSNSFIARARAALELCDHLKEHVKKHPNARHLIVAHSHGGTVVVSAVTRLHMVGHRKTVGAVRGVMTLAAPFVSLASAEKENYTGLLYLFSFFTAWFAFLLAIVYFSSSGHPYLAGWLSFMSACICLGALSRNDFRTKSKGVLARVVAVAAAILYAASFAGMVYCAWHGASELVHTAIDDSQHFFRQLGDVLRSTRDVAVFSLLLLASTLAALLALTIGRQNGQPFRGILRQFYLTLPSFLILPIVVYACADALSTDSGFAVAFLFLPPFLAGGTLFLVAKVASVVSLERFASLVSPLLDWKEPPELPVPLLALRAPRDEATMSIVFAQAARFVITKSGRALLFPVELVFSSWWRVAILTIALAVAPYVFVSWPEFAQAWYLKTVISLLACFAIIAFGVFFYALAALAVYLLLLFLSGAIMALAVGWEMPVLQLYGKVDCEPLPRIENSRNARTVIDWTVDQRVTDEKPASGALHHSLYDYPSVRAFVAEWIVERCGPASEV